MRSHHYVALAIVCTALWVTFLVRAAAQQIQDTQPLPLPFGANGFGGVRIIRDGGGAAPPITLSAEQMGALKTLYAVPKEMPVPADNPFTAEKVALGQKLFFDPTLSANGKVACATCHDVRHGFTDGKAQSTGVMGERLARHTPTIINLAWSASYFWDGRAKTLEQQAVMPIAEAKEMGMPHEVMVSRLQADAAYGPLFQRVFPGEGASTANVAKALAAFERALVFADAPFDRWIAGDESAISEAAKRGFVEFNTRAGCAQCHSGWNFTDGKFHDIGVRSEDVGRFGVEANEQLKHWFKTPGLRNIAERAPYMHNGQMGSLGAVLQFYRDFVRRSTLSPEMRRVRTGGAQDIIAFLRTLTSSMPTELVRLQETLDRQTGANGATVAAN